MRPELDDTLAAGSGTDPAHTATAPASDRPSSAKGLAVGQQLGHFKIERPLGAGGMGEVYLATDLALDRPVAIKVLPEDVARDPVRRDRMIREARAQARVAHPNVAHIYFVGEEQGRLYFAMEYVAGQTLSERIAKGPVSIDDALAIIRAAALGLREAQRSGFTHRDVKPSNLMVDNHGVVKVLDFGLVANVSSAIGDGPVAQTSTAGTPLYMAPEQARGEPIDFRADIYALGATLYQLVSGRPPFEADTLAALLSKHASDERPSVPRRAGQARTTIATVDALCAKMMAPDPEDRFATYDQLIRELELASLAHTRPAGFWVRSIATLIDLMVVAIVVALSFAVLRIQRETGSVQLDLGPFMFATYGVYAMITTALMGRTFGQALFELDVVEVTTGSRPSLARSAARAWLAVAVPLTAETIAYSVRAAGYELSGIGSVLRVNLLVVVMLLVWASIRVPGKRTVWDKISGTMVRYRTTRAAAS
jgi:hypothetical protein